jgi:formylmethanofuran dehydrogenase subunit B
MMSATYENMACTQCGCVCDDLRLTVEAGRIVRAEGSCHLSEPWFLQQSPQPRPVAEIAGVPASLETALDRAADILRKARAPLIYGLARSSTEGQRAAAALADRIGATIDTNASHCHAHSVMAVQDAGEQTCSLGEVKNRADLVIYWGTNPLESHPRHMERYAVDPTGEFVPGGRADRYVVVVDVKKTESAARADLFLKVKPGADFDVLWTLRALVKGLDVPAEPKLVDLARRMKACRFGVAFFGLGLSLSRGGHRNVEALLRLVRDLNHHTRFYARRMRVQGDVSGADLVLAWQTGYPFSVNLGRGYPRYNPDEFSAAGLLERGEVDACVLVGSEGVPRFPQAARDALSKIPTVALEYPTFASTVLPTVRFTTAVYGLHVPGTAYRMDEIPVPLRACLLPFYPSDDRVLSELERRCS